MEGDSRKISLCLTNYNRDEMLFEAFEKVYEDERISEIVISDDHSDINIYKQLQILWEYFPKVKMFRNIRNVDCYFNKKNAIELATNKWCILLDSDNKINTLYLNRIFDLEWNDDTIYTPDFARPQFDFTPYSDLTVTKENVSSYIDKPMFEVMLNACNYFVNRDEYLKVWDGSVDPVTSDSIFFTSKWIESGRKINVVRDMQYEHRIHNGSHYKTQNHRTPNGFHESILNKLRQLQ